MLIREDKGVKLIKERGKYIVKGIEFDKLKDALDYYFELILE